MMRRRKGAATSQGVIRKGAQSARAAGPSTAEEAPVSGSGAANPAPDAGSTSGEGGSGWGGLLTPDSATVVLIDLQPSVALAVRSIDGRILVNNATALAKTAKAFGVPLVLSTIHENADESPFPELLAAAGPDTPIIMRSSRRNAWADAGFVRAIEAAGRRRLVMGGLWTEVALTLTALSTLEAGYEVYVVEDVAGGTSRGRHDTAVHRMVQAGAVPVTWLQVNHECLDAMDTPGTRLAVREIEAAHANPAPRG